MAVSGWGVFLILLVLVVLIGGGGYIAYGQYRARRLGLPPPNLNPFARNRSDPAAYRAPAPAPSSALAWISDKFSSFRNKRTAGGAYESTGYAGATRGDQQDRRGFGPLDPDEAWDSRVENEAGGYYEEQELGLQDPSRGPYGGSGYGDAALGQERGRSRSRQRQADGGFEEHGHDGGGQKLDPFGDAAEPSNISLRAVSPRPVLDTGNAGPGQRVPSAHKKQQSSLGTLGSADGSPTERKSMFTEDV